jgi:RNA polymerase sigma-70 factor, ECF subfamily
VEPRPIPRKSERDGTLSALFATYCVTTTPFERETSSVSTETVIQAQAGDHAAFEALAHSVARRLFGTAMLIIRDRDGANDAVQETLIEAWRNLPQLRDPEAFDGWLNRILVRSCYRAIKARQRRRIEVEITEVNAVTSSVENRVGAIDQLDRALRRLTAEQRAVLVLHHRLGLQLDETSVALGIPVGTVKSRLNRATIALRAALAAESRDLAVPEGQTA